MESSCAELAAVQNNCFVCVNKAAKMLSHDLPDCLSSLRCTLFTVYWQRYHSDITRQKQYQYVHQRDEECILLKILLLSKFVKLIFPFN